MASLGDYTAIREALRAAIVSAWTLKPTSVKFGAPLLPKETPQLPYVCCNLQPVPMSFSGQTGTVRSLNQDYVFKIYAAFRRPEPNQDSESFNIEKANALALVLEVDTLFASVGMLPHVSSIDPNDWFEAWEGATGFSIEFSMLVNRAWGT